MPVVSVPQIVPPRININRYVQNGKIPSPILPSETRRSLNHALRYRGRELLRVSGWLDGVPIASGVRYQSFFRSSPYPRSVVFDLLIQKGGAASEVAIGIGAFVARFTLSTAAPSSGFDALTSARLVVPSSAIALDTNHMIVVADTAARTVAVTAYESGPIENTANGYVNPLFATGQPILIADRNETATFGNKMARRQCAHIFNYSPDLLAGSTAGGITTTSAAGINILDSSSAPSANTLGYTVDMRFKNYEGNANVPCVLAHYGNASAGAGMFTLRNSAGSIVATVFGILAADGWRTTTFALPSTLAKYDLYAQSASGTVNTKAVSCYQLRT